MSILGIHKEAISDQGRSQLAMTVQDGYVEGSHAILEKVRENNDNTMHVQSSQYRLTRFMKKIYEMYNIGFMGIDTRGTFAKKIMVYEQVGHKGDLC